MSNPIAKTNDLIFSEIAVLLAIVVAFIGTSIYGLTPISSLIEITALIVLTFLWKQIANAQAPLFALLLARLALLVTRQLPLLSDWPMDLYFIVFCCWGPLRKIYDIDFSSRWSVKFSKKEWLSLVAISVSSMICLTLYFMAHTEVAQKFPFPEVPLWAIPFVICGIAFVNALREELLYRVVFQRTFIGTLSITGAISLQALAFGFLHFKNGFPQGWIGVGLTFLFGLLMGAQYWWSRSITLAWFTHALVDAGMFTIILLNR